MKFIYHDNKNKIARTNVGKILLEVEAESITLADKVFWEQIGYDPRKAPHVGCECITQTWRSTSKHE